MIQILDQFNNKVENIYNYTNEYYSKPVEISCSNSQFFTFKLSFNGVSFNCKKILVFIKQKQNVQWE